MGISFGYLVIGSGWVIGEVVVRWWEWCGVLCCCVVGGDVCCGYRCGFDWFGGCDGELGCCGCYYDGISCC